MSHHYETMGLGIRDKWKVHLLLSSGDGRVQDGAGMGTGHGAQWVAELCWTWV